MTTERQQRGEEVGSQSNVLLLDSHSREAGRDSENLTMDNSLVRTLVSLAGRGKEFLMLLVIIYLLVELNRDIGRLQENVDQVNKELGQFDERLDSVDKTLAEVKTVLKIKLGYTTEE